MRIFPIITATLVCIAIFFAVFQREALVNFAARFGAQDSMPPADDAAPGPLATAPSETQD